MKYTAFIFSIPGLLLLFSCEGPECRSTNKIFNKHSPDSKAYKDELIKKLRAAGGSDLDYTFGAYWETYQKADTLEYIRVHVKGDNLCADMVLAIKDSRKGIEDVLNKKMMGYRGAELEDLRYEVYQDSMNTEFVFKEVSAILD